MKRIGGNQIWKSYSNKVKKKSFDLFSLKSLTKRAKKLIELSHEQIYFEKPFFSQMNDFIRDLFSESLLQVFINMSCEMFCLKIMLLTLWRPLRRKLRMRWFSDVSKVNESSFFNSDLRFLMCIVLNIPI